MTELPPETLRTVDLTVMGEGRYKATNRARRGAADRLRVTTLTSPRSSCSSPRSPAAVPIDLELVTDKRAPFETFAARAAGHKVRDEHGSHLVQLSVTFDVTFPAGEDGDAAREVVPRTLKQIEDRLCTVSVAR